MAGDPGTQKLEAVLAPLDAERRAVADALRKEIRARGPHLREDVKWAAPVWSGTGLVIGLMIFDHHINLGFFRGAELAERHPAIAGTGKSLRHIRIPTPKDARSAAVRAAIRDAIRLDAASPAASAGRTKR
jgi:hypothetical protein